MGRAGSSMSGKKLPGMDTFADKLKRFVIYPLAYLTWFTGITSTLIRMVSRHPGVIVLNYHRINERTDAKAGGYTENITSVANLNKHVDYLKKHFSFITPDGLLSYLTGQREIKGVQILLTFDDGYKDTYQFGLPVLRRHELPAIIFVTTGILNSTFVLPADRYVESADNGAGSSPQSCDALYLNSEDIRDIQSLGLQIGSHTVTHPVLAELSLQDQEMEIASSRNKLEEFTLSPVRFFSYPIGKTSRETPHLVQRTGYQMAFGNRRGYITRGADRFDLPRLSACNHPVPVLAFKIVMTKLFQWIHP